MKSRENGGKGPGVGKREKAEKYNYGGKKDKEKRWKGEGRGQRSNLAFHRSGRDVAGGPPCAAEPGKGQGARAWVSDPSRAQATPRGTAESGGQADVMRRQTGGAELSGGGGRKQKTR